MFISVTFKSAFPSNKRGTSYLQNVIKSNIFLLLTKLSIYIIFFHTDIFRNCIPSSVYVCVNDRCWKFSICCKFTITELLKLSKGITSRHSNIVLKLEKMKFTNPVKNNVQLREEINGTKGTKQLQNKKQTLNIKRLAYHNW